MIVQKKYWPERKAHRQMCRERSAQRSKDRNRKNRTRTCTDHRRRNKKQKKITKFIKKITVKVVDQQQKPRGIATAAIG